jgi:hemerythrin-like metal-binding protein
VNKQQIYFPEWLYNALPFFYLGSGVLTIAMLGNAMAVLSGLTLISAGAVVWSLRYRYRQAFSQSAGRLNLPGQGSQPPSSERLVQIVWRDSFDCGHPVIDAQHRRLFGIGNELINAVLTNKPKLDLEILLYELVNDITDHFCAEELILAQTMHPLSRQHQEQHHALLNRAKRLRDHYLAGKLVARELVTFIAYDVITEHVLKEDVKWIPSLQARDNATPDAWLPIEPQPAMVRHATGLTGA